MHAEEEKEGGGPSAGVTSGHVKSLPDFPGFMFFRMQRGLCEISNFRASYCSSTRAVPQYRYISIYHKQLKFPRRWGLFSAVRSLPPPRLGLPRPNDHWTTAFAAPDAPMPVCVAAGAASAVVALVQL